MSMSPKRCFFSGYPASACLLGLAGRFLFRMKDVAGRRKGILRTGLATQPRNYLLTALLTLQIGVIQAQTELGFKAGMLLSKPAIHNSSYREFHRTEFSPGYSLGGHVKFDIIGRLSLVCEPSWSVKGWKVKSVLSDYNWNQLHVHMIDLPVLARLGGGARHFRYYLTMGPEMNFWLAGSGKVGLDDQNQGITNIYTYTLNFSDPVFTSDVMNMFPAERVQISFVIGSGIQFEIVENRFLSVDVRYNMGNSFFGLNPGGAIPFMGISENFEARLNTIAISAIYSMRILSR